MSAAFRLAKKKYTQNDLRRIMNETKANKVQANVKKIDSPLAKYNDQGQLMCVLCKSVVRSESVWTVHINAKQHKENVALAKQLKEKTQNFTVTSTETSSSAMKRPATPPPLGDPANKKVKGILKNTEPPSSTATSKANDSELPSDFFDATTKSIGKSKNFFETTLDKTTIRRDLVNIRLERHRAEEPQQQMETDENIPNNGAAEEGEDKLPEGFFDDPKKDAKARNLEYKDPNDEEWDKFQKEIKEATNVSIAIINEEQEESTAERQITEIDEQIRNWSRVLCLEKKKEEVSLEKKMKKEVKKEKDESDEEEDDVNFDEFLDWRAKNSHK